MKPPNYDGWLHINRFLSFNEDELEMPDAGNLGATTKAIAPIFVRALCGHDF